ncbi:hypothetical protein ANTRET_LOCUS815 [Anthophora retusa]
MSIKRKQKWKDVSNCHGCLAVVNVQIETLLLRSIIESKIKEIASSVVRCCINYVQWAFIAVRYSNSKLSFHNRYHSKNRFNFLHSSIIVSFSTTNRSNIHDSFTMAIILYEIYFSNLIFPNYYCVLGVCRCREREREREKERRREVVEIADQTVHAIVFDNRLIGCSLHPYSTVSPLIL